VQLQWRLAAVDLNDILVMLDVLMLRRLEAKSGITCNPHTFRRTFAVLLRKAGVDTMTIKELGRRESLEMVQRYTRSFSFQDSMKFYKSPLS
jgi:site-specific recombinase XerD